uniref:Uncharacterized protein n=1 Tax=Noctiluca scintillans TaxID=2966 RepID=A0A7S1B1V4_NOCSC|mmetsp:Transcript_9094/g.25390  ORF Transcript_9094/g.25390 Transcript_9094/m.25390 type:complete len:131 (+) Transcript_9094:111-503(+)
MPKMATARQMACAWWKTSRGCARRLVATSSVGALLGHFGGGGGGDERSDHDKLEEHDCLVHWKLAERRAARGGCAGDLEQRQSEANHDRGENGVRGADSVARQTRSRRREMTHQRKTPLIPILMTYRACV